MFFIVIFLAAPITLYLAAFAHLEPPLGPFIDQANPIVLYILICLALYVLGAPLNTWAFSTQLQFDDPDSERQKWHKLSQSRLRLFDPDYRLEGWNHSRYAPKNRARGETITGHAFSRATVVMVLVCVLLIPTLNPNVTTTENIIYLGAIAALVWWFSMMVLGAIYRRTAWFEIKKTLGEKVVPEPVEAPAYVWTKDYALGKQERPNPTWGPTFEFDKPQPKASPRDFEHEVAWLIQQISGHQTRVVGGAGDGGVDIKVFDGQQLVGIVQCKAYDPTKALPPMFIRELNTCKRTHKVKTAYLVTTGRFSQTSREEAARLGIKLIDGQELDQIRLKLQYGVGRVGEDRPTDEWGNSPSADSSRWQPPGGRSL